MERSPANRPFRKLDSAVVLERVDSTASSYAYLHQDPARPSTSKAKADGEATDASPIALDISIRYGRAGLLIVLAVAALVAVTLTLKRGVELGRFDASTKNADEQKQLIDDYNSYTGNVASIFGKPVEIVVALAVQVVLLRVVTASLLRAEVSWKTDAITLALTAGVGYLVSNGLNALNVQPLSPEITAVISAADLTFVPEVSLSDAASRYTNLTQTFSERIPKNPIINTVLRNLVLPRVPLKRSICDVTNVFDASNALPDIVQEYGFSQRDWQSRLLEEAPEPKQLRVVVNPSNTSAKQPMNLPMNASVAADLFLHSLLLAPYYFQWAQLPPFIDETNVTGKVESVARVVGLLPPLIPARDETTQRDWFIRASAKALSNQLKTASNISRSDVVMEFSHVDISPTMRVDAITTEFEVDPTHIADESSKDKSTWYNSLIRNLQCGPWPLRCTMKNPVRTSTEDTTFDPPPQVQVFGVCVSDDGKEELSFEKAYTSSSDVRNFLHCADTSNTSLMVMTIGKRFVADSISQNKTGNASGVFDSPGGNVITNLRRVYSFTMAKLSWELADLTTELNASCSADAGSCRGLRLPLAPPISSPSLRQELIVGVDALPVNLVTPLQVIPSIRSGPRFLPLVQLHEPWAKELIPPSYELTALTIDPLLPHNLGKVSWNQQGPQTTMCERQVEDRLQLVFNNHLYIEHGLQTAYTAAAFFLLQNGVVKDVIEVNAAQTSLNFQQNKETIVLVASIPAQNAWLTLGGCAVLVGGFCLVFVWGWLTAKTKTSDRCGGLGHVMTPHVVARVMLDTVRFPPMLLHRHVISTDTSDDFGDALKKDKLVPVEGFVIDGLGLQPPQRGTDEYTF